jgi:hypothetical protein
MKEKELLLWMLEPAVELISFWNLRVEARRIRTGASKREKEKPSAPVILATQEAEIRGIVVQSQPGAIVCEIELLKVLDISSNPRTEKKKRKVGQRVQECQASWEWKSRNLWKAGMSISHIFWDRSTEETVLLTQ